MQITLNQREIEAAVRKSILSLGIGSGMSFAIEFTNGRAPNGLTATVNLESPEDAGANPVASAPVVQAVAQPVANPAPAVAVSQPSPLAAAFAADAPAQPKEVPQPEPIPEPAAVAQPAPVSTPASNDGIKLFG